MLPGYDLSFRVSHHGYHIDYARSVAELEQWIDLADLEEALRLAAGPALQLPLALSCCSERSPGGGVPGARVPGDETTAGLTGAVGDEQPAAGRRSHQALLDEDVHAAPHSADLPE